MNILVIADPGKCIGCRTCEVACVLAHAAPDAIHKLAAAHFIPRLKLIKTSKVSTPVQCRQCEDAPCAKVCPTGALVLNHNSVQVVQTRCIGCKSCVMACPYGAMEIVTREAVLQQRQPTAGGPPVEATSAICAFIALRGHPVSKCARPRRFIRSTPKFSRITCARNANRRQLHNCRIVLRFAFPVEF